MKMEECILAKRRYLLTSSRGIIARKTIVDILTAVRDKNFKNILTFVGNSRQDNSLNRPERGLQNSILHYVKT
jgi:hypothetical protein